MYILAWSDVFQDRYGDEFLKHFVAVCDDDGEPAGKVYNCSTRNIAGNLAEKMGRDRRLDVVDETMW